MLFHLFKFVTQLLAGWLLAFFSGWLFKYLVISLSSEQLFCHQNLTTKLLLRVKLECNQCYREVKFCYRLHVPRPHLEQQSTTELTNDFKPMKSKLLSFTSSNSCKVIKLSLSAFSSFAVASWNLQIDFLSRKKTQEAASVITQFFYFSYLIIKRLYLGCSFFSFN